MTRFPIDAFPIEGEADPFQLGDDFDLFGITGDGRCVTNADRSAPYETWLAFGALDALIHWRGRWFVGKLATVGVGGLNGLCPVGPFQEITGNDAGRWFCSPERFGRIPPEARALFAERQALDASATTSTATADPADDRRADVATSTTTRPTTSKRPTPPDDALAVRLYESVQGGLPFKAAARELGIIDRLKYAERLYGRAKRRANRAKQKAGQGDDEKPVKPF